LPPVVSKLEIQYTQVPAKGGKSDASSSSTSSSGTTNNDRKSSKASTATINSLEMALPSLYNQQTKFLNLSALASKVVCMQQTVLCVAFNVRQQVACVHVAVCVCVCVYVRARAQNGWCDMNNDSFITTLWQVIQRLFPNVESLNLASNNIKRLNGFSSMAQLLPNVRNLSFNLNNIADFKELDHLNGTRLEQVILALCASHCIAVIPTS
jgi:hypothetical protein